MRVTRIRTASLGLLAAAAAGCASGGASSSSGVSPANIEAQAAQGKVGPALLEWTGSFKRHVLHDPNSLTPTRIDASGSVQLVADGPSLTHATVNVRLPQYQDPMRLYWAVASGPCGSNAIPLLNVSQFPQISMSTGAGSIETSLSFALPTTGTYHVNVYGPNSDGRDEAGVFTCAELKLGQKKD